MNRTLSLTRLDYLTIKPYLTLKNIVLFLIVSAIIGFGTGEPSALIGMLMMYGTIYASYPFAVGEKNGIDTLYKTLPLKRSNVVAGRYFFSLSLNIITGALSFLVSAILMTALKKEIDFIEILITILTCFIIFSIVEAIQLPIYFKFGYAKAKFLAYLSLAAFPAAVMAISAFVGKDSFFTFLNNMFLEIQANGLITGILVAAIWICVMLLSCSLSYDFYKKREF